MGFGLQDEVMTPDHGVGIVWGRAPNGKIIVRLNVQVVVDPKKKAESLNGWQYNYDEDKLTAAPKKGKR